MLRIVLALSTVVLTSFAPGVGAQICTPFTDVAASNQFCSNIQWMFNRGVTLGCGPNTYCPTQFVTREQMAALMNRLADKVTLQQGGNAFGATAVLGTTDNQALDIRANGSRVMRYEPDAFGPNLIGGHPANTVTAGVRAATIGGGGGLTPNRVTDVWGTVGGGYANRAGDDAGTPNERTAATVGGGASNTASGSYSTVAGGRAGMAGGTNSTVAGGENNTASGDNSTVAGGSTNIAAGLSSLAAGFHAHANADGCFVWGDTSTGNEIRCDAANRFAVRSLGGVFFFAGGNTQPTYTGVVLPPGGTAWVPGSDRRIKDNLRDLDPLDVLQRLLALPITTWNLKAQDPSIRHMGPMAQDFRAAFGLGETELGINTLDADGVAFAAIQGLNAKLEAAVAAQRDEIAELKRTVEHLLANLPQDTRRASAR